MLLPRQLREEGGPAALAELVAMDEQGCFVDDGDEEGEEEDEDDGDQSSSHGKVRRLLVHALSFLSLSPTFTLSQDPY